VLDLLGCLRALADRDYAGWLMVEQDSSWSPPSEAAAIGRRVLALALAVVGSERPQPLTADGSAP
jgi:sugar phosphate isomerase/epimerase